LVHSRPVSEQKCPEIPVRVSPNQPVSFSPIAPQPSSFKFGDQGQSTSPQPSGNSPPVIKTPRVKRILKGFQRTPTPHPKGYAFHKVTPQAPVNKTSTSPELALGPIRESPGKRSRHHLDKFDNDSPYDRPSCNPGWSATGNHYRFARSASRSPSPSMAPPKKRLATAGCNNNLVHEPQPSRASPSLSPYDIDELADNIASRLTSYLPRSPSPPDVKPQVQDINAQALAEHTQNLQVPQTHQPVSVPYRTADSPPGSTTIRAALFEFHSETCATSSSCHPGRRAATASLGYPSST